jgi:hypothetical protein
MEAICFARNRWSSGRRVRVKNGQWAALRNLAGSKSGTTGKYSCWQHFVLRILHGVPKFPEIQHALPKSVLFRAVAADMD